MSRTALSTATAARLKSYASARMLVQTCVRIRPALVPSTLTLPCLFLAKPPRPPRGTIMPHAYGTFYVPGGSDVLATDQIQYGGVVYDVTEASPATADLAITPVSVHRWFFHVPVTFGQVIKPASTTGGYTPTRSTVLTTLAQVSVLRSTEESPALALFDDRFIELAIPYPWTVTLLNEMRVTIGSDIYNVRSIIDPDQTQRTLIIGAERITPSTARRSP